MLTFDTHNKLSEYIRSESKITDEIIDDYIEPTYDTIGKFIVHCMGAIMKTRMLDSHECSAVLNMLLDKYRHPYTNIAHAHAAVFEATRYLLQFIMQSTRFEPLTEKDLT